MIAIYSKDLGGPLEDSSEDKPGSSLDDILNPPRHQPLSFSSKRLIHESDTPHSKSHSSSSSSSSQNKPDDEQENREGEELVISGNRQEMLEFIEEGIHGAKLQVEF